jgi:hypothetical protein
MVIEKSGSIFSLRGRLLITPRAHADPRAPQRLLIVLLRRRNARDQQCQRIAADRILEQLRELRVAVVDVRLRRQMLDAVK